MNTTDPTVSVIISDFGRSNLRDAVEFRMRQHVSAVLIFDNDSGTPPPGLAPGDAHVIDTSDGAELLTPATSVCERAGQISPHCWMTTTSAGEATLSRLC